VAFGEWVYPGNMQANAVEASKRLGQTGRSGEADGCGGADGVRESAVGKGLGGGRDGQV
jgi:hypothetical protein